MHGVDLAAPLSASVVRDLRLALLAFKVIFFCDQQLTRDQHVALAAAFGEPSIHPLITQPLGPPLRLSGLLAATRTMERTLVTGEQPV